MVTWNVDVLDLQDVMIVQVGRFYFRPYKMYLRSQKYHYSPTYIFDTPYYMYLQALNKRKKVHEYILCIIRT